MTKLAIAAQDGPVVLVAHSYGGVVMTEAGTDPNVAGLVYIASFAPDEGESINTLIADPPPEAPVAPLAPQDGFLFLDKEKFPAAFAADVDPEHAAFMADSQVPWGIAAIATEVSEPAWRSRPSWWLIATDDLIIPPDLQRVMSKRAGSKVVEVPGNHAIYVSNPTAAICPDCFAPSRSPAPRISRSCDAIWKPAPSSENFCNTASRCLASVESDASAGTMR